MDESQWMYGMILYWLDRWHHLSHMAFVVPTNANNLCNFYTILYNFYVTDTV